MIRRSSVLTGILALAGAAVLLTGCGGGSGSTTSPTPTPTVTATKTATPTPTPTPTPPPPPPAPKSSAANIPKSCGAVGTADSRADTIDTMKLQSDGTGFTRPVPQGAKLVLGCDWIVGDSTGILLLISTAAPADIVTAIAGMPAQGYECQIADDFGAQECSKPGSNADSEFVIVARDDVWVFMQASNINERILLSDLASQIFKS
jgi:hypothetical protein